MKNNESWHKTVYYYHSSDYFLTDYNRKKHSDNNNISQVHQIVSLITGYN